MDFTDDLNAKLGLEAGARDDGGRESERLERANHELWRENQRLARSIAEQQLDPAGRSGSGAASFLRKMHAIEAELEQARRSLDEAEAERDHLKGVVESIESSPSWRVTKPLRAIKRAFRRR